MRRLARRVSAAVLLPPLLALAACAPAQTQPAQTQTAAKPWAVRAVIVVTFDNEYQLWAQHEDLAQTVDVPGVPEPVHANSAHTVLAMVSGVSLVNSAASMMALGLDPRFDLTHAYFLINGIAGVDPADASLGSAVWADFVVGDVLREIDAREAPADWPYGLFPLGAKAPNPPAVTQPNLNCIFALNPRLTAWAFAQTKDLKLPDDPAIAQFRARYTGLPNAQRPPFVLIGGDLASDHYWHGKTLTQFANDFVRVSTAGQANFVITEMEDSGFLNSLARLDAIHRVDIDRVLVLRTASNYSMQPPGGSAVDSLTDGSPSGGAIAFQSAWLCGSTVLHAILAHWDTLYGHIPQ